MEKRARVFRRGRRELARVRTDRQTVLAQAPDGGGRVTGRNFKLCDFCNVETTSPLLFIEVGGFNLDVCPTCWKTQFFVKISPEDEEE